MCDGPDHGYANGWDKDDVGGPESGPLGEDHELNAAEGYSSLTTADWHQLMNLTARAAGDIVLAKGMEEGKRHPIYQALELSYSFANATLKNTLKHSDHH